MQPPLDDADPLVVVDQKPVPSDPQHVARVARLRTLPAPVGIVLLGTGVVGGVLPGPFGAPFLLAGGLVLAPRMFGRFDRFVERRFPGFHRTGMVAIERFVNDLETRFPLTRRKRDN